MQLTFLHAVAIYHKFISLIQMSVKNSLTNPH